MKLDIFQYLWHTVHGGNMARQQRGRAVQLPFERFPFTSEEVWSIRKKLLTTLEQRCDPDEDESFVVHNNDIIALAVRAVRLGEPNMVVEGPFLATLYESAWASFRAAKQCGCDDAEARRSAITMTQVHLEFHLGILDHMRVSGYRDDA
jgi:hypothetical protein